MVINDPVKNNGLYKNQNAGQKDIGNHRKTFPYGNLNQKLGIRLHKLKIQPHWWIDQNRYPHKKSICEQQEYVNRV